MSLVNSAYEVVSRRDSDFAKLSSISCISFRISRRLTFSFPRFLRTFINLYRSDPMERYFAARFVRAQYCRNVTADHSMIASETRCEQLRRTVGTSSRTTVYFNDVSKAESVLSGSIDPRWVLSVSKLRPKLAPDAATQRRVSAIARLAPKRTSSFHWTTVPEMKPRTYFYIVTETRTPIRLLGRQTAAIRNTFVFAQPRNYNLVQVASEKDERSRTCTRENVFSVVCTENAGDRPSSFDRLDASIDAAKDYRLLP